MRPEIYDISPSIIVKGVKSAKIFIVVPLQLPIWKKKVMRNVYAKVFLGIGQTSKCVWSGQKTNAKRMHDRHLYKVTQFHKVPNIVPCL